MHGPQARLHETKEKLVIPGGRVGRIKKADFIKHRAPPHRMTSRDAIHHDRGRMIGRMDHLSEHVRAGPGVVGHQGCEVIAIGQVGLRMRLQRRREELQRVGTMRVVRIRVRDVFPPCHPDGPVPGRIQRLTLGPMILDVLMPLLELLHNRPLVLRGTAVDHQDLCL